ncbi:nuclease-related domain-containing DEAD/DEAH box helicase [Leekyejoonella antrihumi]|uniref:Nuclease n=1 Tax=Leekyejoonella antrihumi TaxID=1660198 RepID=A0A563DZ32_9MICO|nr:NERD domain-containing protein [Leekyejoonella antrihumi]TWP35222.1 nuclease [Leekyejoonella antrihumi]
MTARTAPDQPSFVTRSEREVWERLVNQLAPEDVVLANVRLTDESKDHEADLVALLPGRGVVVIEVKGGSVFVGTDQRWWQRTSHGDRCIRPVDQVRESRYALRHYVEQDPRWRQRAHGRVRWAHTVVVPYTLLAEDFATPDCPRWMVQGREDQEHLGERVGAVPLRQEHGCRVPTEDDVSLILEILQGRSLPAYDITAEAMERQADSGRLTLEQTALLQVTRLLHRVEVRGGAGSGKTVLAMTQAKQLARGRAGRKPQRVALVCYSIGLAEHFKREVDSWHRKDRPAFVGTFHDLGRLWGVGDGDRSDSDFWERRLPIEMAELAGNLEVRDRFDAFVVDEAQDFADSWWAPIIAGLRDEEEGGLYLYTDENQRIFARFGQPPVPLIPLVLDHNLRNTQQIADAFGPLAPMRMRLRGGDGPKVTVVPTTAHQAISVADDQVDRLIDEGWQPRDIALLTTRARHPVQIERTEALGQNGYWKSFWEEDDAFYGHVLGCKGLERRTVVLCVNESKAQDRSRERLYVGMSRATDQLVVVGDPEVIRAMGGEEVARRLGI